MCYLFTRCITKTALFSIFILAVSQITIVCVEKVTNNEESTETL